MGRTRLSTNEEQNYYCSEVIPDIAGTYSGTLVICGGGKTFWNDYERAMNMVGKCDTMAVNISSMFVPNLTHMFSLHHRHISHLKAWRDVEYAEKKVICHAIKEYPNTDYAWKLAMAASTSGLMAVVLGWILGYRKFILCGVPMDNSGYYYKPEFNETFPDPVSQRDIGNIQTRFGDMVRSMSGNTKKILGEPTPEWIKGESYASTK